MWINAWQTLLLPWVNKNKIRNQFFSSWSCFYCCIKINWLLSTYLNKTVSRRDWAEFWGWGKQISLCLKKLGNLSCSELNHFESRRSEKKEPNLHSFWDFMQHPCIWWTSCVLTLAGLWDAVMVHNKTILRRQGRRKARRPDSKCGNIQLPIFTLVHLSVEGNDSEGVSCKGSEHPSDPKQNKLMNTYHQIYIMLCMQSKPWESVEDIASIGYFWLLETETWKRTNSVASANTP